ncbi:MAG: NHL repeat-containing protein [Turneriella sp.]
MADRNNHRVLIFNGLPTGNTATADAVLGQTSLTAGLINAGGGATISAQGFNEPCGVAVRNSGEVLVVDRANNRVVIFASVPTSLGTWNAYRVIGQPNMASGTANNFSVANGGKLNDPSAVHVIDGKIYIADRNNHRILVFNSLPTSDGASADLIIGQPDASTVNVGTDYATSSSYLNHPYEVHKSGNQFFVADGDNNRVLIYNAVPSVADTRPNMVLGQAGSTGGFANRSGPVAANTLYLPVSVAVVSGKLAIADQNNHRLLFYDFPLSNGQAASYVLGQSNFLGSSFGTTASKYKYPKSFVIDNGYIWVADIDNNRIQVMQLPF